MIRPNDIVYISGPMTGKPLLNHPRFFGMAGILRHAYDCDVLNPARHPLGRPYQWYMNHAFADISHATVIVFLDGWRESRGAMQEYAAAIRRGREIRMIEEADLMVDLADRYGTEVWKYA